MKNKLLYSFFIASFLSSVQSNIDYQFIKIGLSNKIEKWIKANELSWYRAFFFNADPERWNICDKKDLIVNEIMNHVYASNPGTQPEAMDLARKQLKVVLGSYIIQRADEFIHNENVPSYKMQSVKAITHKEVQDQFNEAMNKCQTNPLGCMNDFLDNLPQIATREAKKYSIDYASIKHELVRAIDAMITANLIVNKYAIVERIIEVVKTYRPENQNQARAKAWELLYPAIEQSLVDYCELTARKMITQNYKNPRYNPEGIVLDIKEKEIKTSISSAVAECRNYQTFGNNNCLNDLIARLPSIIKQQIRERLGAPDYEKYQQPKPSAPPMENPKYSEAGKKDDGIDEIYPDFGIESLSKKISKGAVKRDMCPICFKEFQRGDARVNLNCSSQVCAVCPNCFFASRYLYNNNVCPACGERHIKNDDYSLQNVVKYVNVAQLKQQCPTQLDKIKQFFPL